MTHWLDAAGTQAVCASRWSEEEQRGVGPQAESAWFRSGSHGAGGTVHEEAERANGSAEQEWRRRADGLMERYADGDEDAFGALYDLLAPRLSRFALRHGASSVDADDVVQQTMLQICAARARFVRGAPVLPWAYAIARNLLRDLWTASDRRAFEEQAAQEEEPALPGPLQDAALELKMLERWLAAELRHLDEKLRDAFLLVNVEGLPVVEAAGVLGISPANAKVRAFRARERLLEAIARHERN